MQNLVNTVGGILGIADPFRPSGVLSLKDFRTGEQMDSNDL
jgi:hypothetical protein